MHFNVAFITTALLASASLVMSTSVTGFFGADCTDRPTNTVTGTGCFTMGSGSTRSIRYTDVPNRIAFYPSGGPNDNCRGNPAVVRGGGSGCVNAPAGFNWESVQVS